MTRVQNWCVGIGLVCFLGSAAFAETPEQKEFRAWGDWMTGGVWSSKDKDGKVEDHVYRWTLGKAFVLMTSKTSPKEKSLMIVGIDPKTGQQTWWSFDSEGVASAVPTPVPMIVALNSGAKSEFAWTFTDPKGPGQAKGVSERKGNDQLWVDITTTVAGKTTQDARMWNRQPLTGPASNIVGPAPAAIPQGLSQVAHVIGKTTAEGNLIDGRKVNGIHSGQWVLDGKFLMYSAAAVDADGITSSYLLIAGIDPATKKPTGWEFDSDGYAGQYTLADDGKSLSGKGYEPGGKLLEFSGTLSTPAGKLLHYAGEGALGGGEKKPSTFTWQRLSP